MTREGRARGVVLDDGGTVEARCVVSNAHPRALLGLVEDAGAWREPFEHYRSESATLRMKERST